MKKLWRYKTLRVLFWGWYGVAWVWAIAYLLKGIVAIQTIPWERLLP